MEEIFMHAQKDENIRVNNNRSTSIGVNDTLDIGANRTKTVGANETNTIEKNQTTTINKGNRSVTVKVGNDTLTIGANRTKTVGNKETNTIKNDQQTTITDGSRSVAIKKGDDSLQIDEGNGSISVPQGEYRVQAKDIKLIATNSIQIACGDGSITFDAEGNITIQAPTLKSLAKVLNDIKGKMVKINS